MATAIATVADASVATNRDLRVLSAVTRSLNVCWQCEGGNFLALATLPSCIWSLMAKNQNTTEKRRREIEKKQKAEDKRRKRRDRKEQAVI